MQDLGDKLRKEKDCEYLSSEVSKLIDTDHSKNYVVDSIRNPAEVDILRDKYSGFFLFGVLADKDVRWRRIKEKYKNDRRTFDAEDDRGSGESFKYGQRVSDAFRRADCVILRQHRTMRGEKSDPR